MIELPSWGRQLLSLFSRRSFEKWAGMSLQTALQLKQIQSSLRESWVIGGERYYGSERNAQKKKMTAFAHAAQPLAEVSIAHPQSNSEEESPHVNAFSSRLLEPLSEEMRVKGWAYSADRPANSATVLDDLFKPQSDRSNFSKNSWNMLGSEELHAPGKYFASRPHRHNELAILSDELGNGVNSNIPLPPASENLKRAIERALSLATAAAESQSQKSMAKKKHLYLAPWPKQ